MDQQSTERLRELLLDLEQAQRRERDLRTQSEALLAGVKALAEASTPEDLFARILDALREPLSFDDAFILRASRESGVLVGTAATDASFLGSRWPVGKTFGRLLQAGRVVVHVDTSAIAEWAAQPESLRMRARSSVCIPLRGVSESALLVCTKREARAFTPGHEQMAKRFQPLATKALQDAERVAQIERANRDMRLVLDSVDQGLMTIDRKGIVVGETSGMIHTWFGDVTSGVSLCDLLARLDSTVALGFEIAWEQVIEGLLPLDVTLQMLPKRIDVDGRTLAIQLRVIGDEDSWTRMLVVLSDITAALERERGEERRREFAACVAYFVRDAEGFLAFWNEAKRIVDDLAPGTTRDRALDLRLIHTLKGNASISGLGSLARVAHEVEQRLIEDAEQSEALLAELITHWQHLEAELAPVLSGDGKQVRIDANEHAWLLRELARVGAPQHLATAVAAWTETRAETSLQRIASRAAAVAERLGKTVSFTVQTDGSRLQNADTRIFGALVHAVRNALDHGIELPDERVAEGKLPSGNIALRARISASGAHLEVEVEDDGRGIDWERVAAKARERGLPHSTHDELTAALFADGVSTRDEVTDISGRGVGLSALREAVLERGGQIEITSVAGRGSLLRCLVPRSREIPMRLSA